jgi:hypothetical protein
MVESVTKNIDTISAVPEVLLQVVYSGFAGLHNNSTFNLSLSLT